MKKLDHRFGDDGEFWISYEDFLKKFQDFDRTRLFGSDWKVAQIWTTLLIPWTVEYHKTYFAFTLVKSGPVVIVLSQLDDRYFRGLEGQYRFELAFRIHRAGREDYVVRSQTPYRMRRSVNVELNLDRGDYEVRVKIAATRRGYYMPIDQVIRENAKTRRDKLTRVGLAYDLAHSKGQFVESLEEKNARESRRLKHQERERRMAKKKILSEREAVHYLKTKSTLRGQKREAIKRGRKTAQKTKQAREGAKQPETIVEDGIEANNDSHNEDHSQTQQNGSDHNRPSDLASGWWSETPEPLSDLSDRELDMEVEAYLKRNKSAAREKSPDKTAPAAQEQPDEFEKDPWNAAVVVGLRVYHKISDEDEDKSLVKLKVVRPSLLELDSNDEGDMDETERKGTGLDVDDSSKDATLVGGVKERKKSILGDGWKVRKQHTF